MGLEVFNSAKLASSIADVTEKQLVAGNTTGLVGDDASVSLYDTLGIALDPSLLNKRDANNGV